MRKTFILSLFSLLLIHTSCSEEQSGEEGIHNDHTEQQEPAFEAVNYETFETIFDKKDDVLYVVNFWATWCKPCVEELPHFMEVKEEMAGEKNFKMVLVSLDMSSDLDTKVKDFMTKNQYKVDLYLLDDVKNMNTWIPKVDPSWSGAIPATVFYKNGSPVYFKEGQLSKQELQQLIKKHI